MKAVSLLLRPDGRCLQPPRLQGHQVSPKSFGLLWCDLGVLCIFVVHNKPTRQVGGIDAVLA